MKILGITGGVGAGKSTILYNINKLCKAYIIEADKLAHELMQPGGSIYLKIIEEFGESIIESTPPFFINRQAMAQLVFNDEKKLNVLNSIVHPEVKKEILNRINSKEISNNNDLFVIEAALLLEDGYSEICDEIWYVYVSDEERIKRLMSSRGYSREKCMSIINSQASESFFRTNCDQVIVNESDPEETLYNLKAMLNKFI